MNTNTETNAQKSRRLSRKWKSEGRCIHCGLERDNPRYVICTPCRDSQKISIKRMKDSRAALLICFRCGKNPVKDGYKTCEVCSKKAYEYRKAHPEYRDRQRQKYMSVKDDVFNAYGGYICTCCGETEPLFMCIDHINGGGEIHRTSIGVGSRGRNMYVWLKKNGFPSGFQVLCQNCNIGKHLNGGICPHHSRK